MSGNQLPSRPKGKARARTPPLTRYGKKRASKTKREAVLRFLCRIDVCWTALFFVFLVCVGAITTCITQIYIARSLRESFSAIHEFRLSVVGRIMDDRYKRVQQLAVGFLTEHLQSFLPEDTEHTMALLCSMIDNYDKNKRFRTTAFISADRLNGAVCTHSISYLDNDSSLMGFVSQDSIVRGSYLVNSTTYMFAQPLDLVSPWPEDTWNVSAALMGYRTQPAFLNAEAYYNGSTDVVATQNFWEYPRDTPHLMVYSLPIGYVARGTTLVPPQSPTDFFQITLDGSEFLAVEGLYASIDSAIAAFIQQTLQDAEPSIYSNNWGQPSVSNGDIYSTTAEVNTTYLNISNISSHIMRAAIKHVDFTSLQTAGYKKTVGFRYKGAPAFVTAWNYVTWGGLAVPLVVASAQSAVTPPYGHLFGIFSGILAAVIFLFTGIFWWFAHTTLSVPLTRMTELLLRSLQSGKRAFFFRGTSSCIEVSEVRQLVTAHNTMIKQLRDIDAFIPPAVRQLLLDGCTAASISESLLHTPNCTTGSGEPRMDSLLKQRMTVVYITIRAQKHGPLSDVFVPFHNSVTTASAAHRQQRLVSVVEKTAQAHNMANSGPFPSPAALAAFLGVIHDLSAQHHGQIQLLSPDSCILHFGTAVRKHMPTPAKKRPRSMPFGNSASLPRSCGETASVDETELRRLAMEDAMDAAAFMFDLQRWVGEREALQLPDVRLLADSGFFICGQYRARGNEQTLHVGLGRDIARKLGHIPALLGIRVAMTEETAVLVHAVRRSHHTGDNNDASGSGSSGSNNGVRKLPVAAFHVGRARLNSDVVILYEALPGEAVNDAVWQRYARCVNDAFGCMMRGDYATAFRTFRSIGEIADLEPGLMPPSLRREAAPSDKEGGAVSTQVTRLMRECVRRLADHDTAAYYYVRHVPLGIDVVLKNMPLPSASDRAKMAAGAAQRSPELTFSNTRAARRPSHHVSTQESRLCIFKVNQRHIVTTNASGQKLRCVLGDFPDHIVDQRDMLWRLPLNVNTFATAQKRGVLFTLLGTAGALCTAAFLTFRDVPPIVSKAIRNAADGPLSDELRSAIPVWVPSEKQRRQVEHLFASHEAVSHPNILHPLAISFSVEGGVVKLWEFCPGGSFRKFIQRYPVLHAVANLRFGLCITSALSYLHERGMVHGSLSLDSIIVGSDGVCRLIGQFTDISVARDVFAVPRTCYVSPAMAAGHAPTAACDMFCYGLLSLEALTRQPAWQWADVDAADGDGDGGQRAAQRQEELLALMAEGGQAFSDAVLQGRVVPHTSVLDEEERNGHHRFVKIDAVKRCLAYDPAERPTAAELWQINRTLLADAGLTIDNGELDSRSW